MHDVISLGNRRPPRPLSLFHPPITHSRTSTPTHPYPSGLVSDGDQRSWNAVLVPVSSPDRYPMYIKQAELTVSVIQGGAHVCIFPELYLYFKSSVPIQRKCISNITILNLTWIEPPSSFELTPVALSPSSNNPFAFDKSALWIPEIKGGPGITLQISDGVVRDSLYKIKFLSAKDNAASGLATKAYTGVINPAISHGATCLNAQINTNVSFGYESAKRATLSIVSTEQTTCSPCDTNRITIVFNVSQEILGSCLNEMTISGLKGFVSKEGVISDQTYPLIFSASAGAADHFGDTGKWDKAAGTFTLRMTSTENQQSNLKSETEYTIKLEFQNPASPRNASVIEINPHQSAETLYSVANLVQYSTIGVGYVCPLAFRTTTCMSYTSRFAADLNTSEKYQMSAIL